MMGMILEVLGDGKWHGVEGLAEECNLACSEVEEVLEFLDYFDLAEFDVASRRVKISRDFLRLLSS